MPENKLYSIGETSKITGVSIQTLRNYSNDGLITPAYIDEQSGYRYFAFHQFHIIDRIKYLRSLDLPLSQIRELISSSSPAAIAEYLTGQAVNLEHQIQLLQKKKQDLEWYSRYFRYYTGDISNQHPHIRHLKQRIILSTDISSFPVDVEATEVRLTSLKTQYSRYGASYLRQFGYLLPYSSVLNKKWEPYKHFIYLAQLPSQYKEEDIFVLPEGDYFCCTFRLRHLDELDLSPLSKIFPDHKVPPFVIADEYEDNLEDFRYCPYELQFLIDSFAAR